MINEPVFCEQTHPGVAVNLRFAERTDTFGLVRLVYTPKGIELWVGGERRWRSSDDHRLVAPQSQAHGGQGDAT